MWIARNFHRIDDDERTVLLRGPLAHRRGHRRFRRRARPALHPVRFSAIPTTLTLTVPSGTVSEDAGTVTVTATLDQPAPAGGVQVTLTSRPIAGRAQVGYHFSLPPAFTIAENQTVGTADITILDNNTVEPDKPLVLNATINVSGIAIKGVTFTLANDDAPV